MDKVRAVSPTASCHFCPVCQSPSTHEVTSLSVESLERLIERELSLTNGALDLGGQRPRQTELRECRGCTHRFFTPPEPGGSDFYRLIGEVAYTGLRWDHELALNVLEPNDTLLDIGAGNGAFAVAASSVVSEVCASDFSASMKLTPNPNLWSFDGSVLQADGGLGDLPAPKSSSAFSVISMFQVLEHLPHPLRTLSAIAEALPESGRLILSVPNSKRFSERYFQGLDFPPHHLHWWNSRSLNAALEAANLAVDAEFVERIWSPKAWVVGSWRWLISRRQADFKIRQMPGTPWPLRNLTRGHSLFVVARRDKR